MSLVVGVSNGVLYSYYAKSSFYFSKFLKLDPHQYGYFGFLVAGGCISGAIISHYLNRKKISQSLIIVIGCWLLLMGSGFFILNQFVKTDYILSFVSFGLFFIMLGFNMTIPNCLSLALEDFTQCLGKAGAILGLSYYSLIGLITFIGGFIEQKGGLDFPLLIMGLSSLNVLCCYFAFGFRPVRLSALK